MNANYNLVLSGGGARGYAHIGVIKALLEAEINLTAISGASSGALVGAFICDGFHPLEIEEIIQKTEPKISFNYTHFWESLLNFNSYTTVLKNNLRSKKIENLQIPLHVSVTNLNTGLQEVMCEGNIIEALTASAAIPVLLPPVFINNTPYADGGVSNNLPVEPFLETKEKIIGVHVNPLPDFDMGASMVKNIDRSMHLIMRSTVLKGMQKCDIFIEPVLLKTIHLFEAKKTKEIISIGYDYTRKEIDLPKLKSTI